MQTRSSSRLVSNPSSNPTPSINPNPKGRNRRHSKQRIKEFNLEELSPPIVTMADQRTMSQFLQAPIEGYEDVIVILAITADNFKLKHELHQLDTFYNVLNSKDQDSLNSTAGGNFLDKMPRECLAIFESKSKVRYSRNKPVVAKVSMNTSTFDISPDVAELKDMVKALLLDKKSQHQAPATVKAVEESCVTCGGAHSYRNCPATDGNVYRDNIQEFISQVFAVNYNQGNTSYRAPMIASTSSSGTLPSNTIANPRSDLKAITTRSGVSYDGPQILPPPFFHPKVVENELEATKDTMYPANNGSTKDVQPLVVQSESPILISKPINSTIIKPVASSVSTPRPNQRPLIPYPSRLQDQKLRDKANDQREKFFQIFKDLNFNIRFVDDLILMPKFGPSIKSLLTNKDKLYFDADPRVPLIPGRSFLKTGRALIDVFEGELTLRVSKEAITFNLDQTSRYSDNYNDMTAKQTDVIDMACEEYSHEVLSFSEVIASGNPTPYYDPIVSTTSSTLTPFENSDFLLEEVDAFLALEDDLTSPKVDQSYLDSEGGILLLQAFLNDDPSLPPPNQGNYLPEVRKEVKINEAKSDKSSIDEPPEVELKDIPPHLESTFLEGDDKLPVIIAKDLSIEEKTNLITVLKSHKRAIAWKLFDIKGIDPEFCTHKILIEEDFEPAVQHQRRVNLKIHDVIEQEVLKVLNAGLIYPISDSPWVSPVHCIPKKGGYTVVENEDNELILTRLVTGWRVCIDYHKLNEATRKDNFPLPFMDQMLERLAENQYYCFLDDFSGSFRLLSKVHKRLLKNSQADDSFLEKDTPFIFSKECVETFQTLKRKLTKAPILIAFDWDMPFELMCNVIDFAIGAVLGQRQDKHFRPIHYASKTMTEA
nr:reverse transcriptase domain-containing protein [Tanacetum cinerariifolium]